MTEENVLIENDQRPTIPSEPAPPITSRFLYVDVAALRAKQLRKGARPRLGAADGLELLHKAERVAMEEVRRGLVSYEIQESKSARTETEA
ncbi:MAG: DNA-directed RNA polymerase subunit omega [Vicinamibacterales bacterium]